MDNYPNLPPYPRSDRRFADIMVAAISEPWNGIPKRHFKSLAESIP